ncbi:MAG: tetratricopeptide repeat protein [Neisseria sp.]|nr:tetratricopeptide repeat protein [Neisseria sp.]
MPALPADTLFIQAQTLLDAAPPDYAAALPLLTRAAAKGHAEAAFQLAGCRFYGHGAAADRQAAVALLQQAAAAGHRYARYNLLQLREADATPIETLLPAYTRLAETGFLPAQLRLMQHFDDSKHPAAQHWAEQAAAQHHPAAQYWLARHYQHAPRPDLARAHALYRQAAAQGLAEAHWQLGNQYRHGQAVAQDFAKAAEHLHQAASDGLAAAQTALAELLQQQEEHAAALGWFQRAAAQHDPDAHVALAQIYLLGRHAERDPACARRHAETAAARQHPEALRLLGDIHRYGLGTEADAERARGYYQRAAALGNAAAHQNLLADSALNHRKDYEQTRQAALDCQHAEQHYQAAFACHYGLKRPQDYAAARRLYLAAAQQGHSKAQTNLGMMYYNGQGRPPDAATAAHWFAQAADQGDPTAQYNLACLYRHGHGVPRDNQSACRWLQRAIESDHPQPEALRQLLQQWAS